MKKRFSAFEIALSAVSCALATILLTIGIYTEILLFTGYLFSCVVLMLPLSKQSYRGYILSYIATCILSFLFNPGRIVDLLPFILFFGLHPIVNELQLKTKINRWVACAIKAAWFDITIVVIWGFLFGMATTPFLGKYFLLIVLVGCAVFFVFYDYLMYRWRTIVNVIVKRISRKGK